MTADDEAGVEPSATQARVAIAEITGTLTTTFDLPTLLDSVAHHARVGFDARSVVVVLLDHRGGSSTSAEIQIVAQARRDGRSTDLTFERSGPGLASARDGAVAMIGDLADARDTRWPDYRSHAHNQGLRGVRAFPIVSLGTSLGSIVVHTDDPWGPSRPNDFGQILANLVALALAIGTTDNRRTDTVDTVNELLQGIAAIATATGIVAELFGLDVDEARLRLRRLARSHDVTVSVYANRVLAAQRDHPDDPGVTGVFRPPPSLAPPQHIDR